MIINPISKSTKGLTPEIIVTAPSGSTLDIMQNDIVLQTYTLGSSETSHTFAVKSVGSYVVRGTKSSLTDNKTITIDSIGQYSIVLLLPTGCIAEYLFDNNLNDTSGNEYGLTNNGVSFSTCDLRGIDHCGYFDGNAYAQAISRVTPMGSPISFSLWEKEESNGYKIFISNGGRYDKYGYDIGVYYHTDGTNNLSFAICGGSYPNPIGGWFYNSVPKTGWHHWVITYTGNTAANGCKMYIDGVQVGSATASGISTWTPSYNLLIGKSTVDSAPMKGWLTGIRIYNKVLTIDEISVLYNNGYGI